MPNYYETVSKLNYWKKKYKNDITEIEQEKKKLLKVISKLKKKNFYFEKWRETDKKKIKLYHEKWVLEKILSYFKGVFIPGLMPRQLKNKALQEHKNRFPFYEKEINIEV